MTKTRRSAVQPVGSVRPRTGRLLGVFTLGLLALGGCGDLQPVATFEPVTDAAALYGSLTLDHRAINLSTAAPYDTVQLTATPRNLLGEPLEGLPAPTFRSTDTVTVWVTPDGLVQARAATPAVQVIAEVTTGDNIRHADTAYVKVTSNPTPPELASLEITFASPEQVELPMSPAGDGVIAHQFLPLVGIQVLSTVQVGALDGAGNPVSGLEVDYVALDPDNVKVDRRSGKVQNVFGPPGEVSIVARTTAYGVVQADTATFTVTPPLFQEIRFEPGVDGAPSLSLTGVNIRAGGYVFWFNFLAETTLDITFDDPTGVEAVPEFCAAFGGFLPHFCESGDIAGFVSGVPPALGGFRVRHFPEPGIYEYETSVGGLKGRIRVVADDEPLLVNEESEE